MFHSAYYQVEPRTADLALAASHIYQHLDMPSVGFSNNEKFFNHIEDFRFNKNIEYQRIGNSSFMRINACAALRLSLWCIKPEESNLKLFCKHVCFFVLKPFAISFDIAMNTALLVAKIAFIALVAIGKCIQKVSFSDVQLGFTLDYGGKNITYHLGTLNTYLGSAILSGLAFTIIEFVAGAAISSLLATSAAVTTSLAAGVAYTILTAFGPKYDIFFRVLNFYAWAYEVNDETELVLDQGKVKYLEEVCGWKDMLENDFKNLASPFLGSSITGYQKSHDTLTVTTHIQTEIFRDAVYVNGSDSDSDSESDLDSGSKLPLPFEGIIDT